MNSFLTRWGNYSRRGNYSREETIWGNTVNNKVKIDEDYKVAFFNGIPIILTLALILKIFQVIVYGLLPLAFLSTLLASSMRRKTKGRRLNKTRIILTLFSGGLVYFAATILVLYSNKNWFFSCDLTTILPRHGPWKELEDLYQLSSIGTVEIKGLFTQKYLGSEELWISLGKIDN